MRQWNGAGRAEHPLKAQRVDDPLQTRRLAAGVVAAKYHQARREWQRDTKRPVDRRRAGGPRQPRTRISDTGGQLPVWPVPWTR